MSATGLCPACGSPLPADAPGGLCPRCLLAGGLETAASPAADAGPPTVAELAPLFPQLELIEVVGAGGMGAVYKARQPRLDRLVALKVLPPRDDPAFAERFTREARALARLNHPGIVHVYDFGQAGGHYYIVMEYVEGVNLRQAERSGKMTPAEALAVVPQICAALQFAHENGVVHRDVKPENVLLDAKGRVKIADFGLAKLLAADEPARLTGTHQAMGTPHYMAPEQWEKPAIVDHRADIYSLGVVFYELLTGELPLGRFAPPSEKVRIDVRLDRVVLRALEKEPERRYQHAGDVKTDVESITAKPPPTTGVEAPRRPWTAGGVVALMVILLSVFAYPIGIVALPVVWLVARRRKQSMVRVVEEGMYSLGLHRPATWMTITCVAGVANALVPWVAVQSGRTRVFFFGFETRFSILPVAITAGFLTLGLFFFVTARVPQSRLLRAWMALAGGAILVALAAVFLHETYGVRYWNVNTAAAFGEKITREFALAVFPGPFVAAGLAIGLMVLGAIDLRGHLLHRPDGTTSSADPVGTAPSEPPPEPPRPAPAPAAAGRRPLRDLLRSPPTWAAAACIAAAAGTLLPWVRLSGLPGFFAVFKFDVSGFEMRELHLGKVIAGLFLVTGAALVVAARQPASRYWRPRVTIAGAVSVLIVWGYFFSTHEWHPVGTTKITIGEKTTEHLDPTDAALLPAAYLPPVVAVLLLILAAIDLAGGPIRQPGSAPPVTSAADRAPPVRRARAGFFRDVGLPVLALGGLGLVAYGVVRSDADRAVRDTAEVVMNGVVVLGPVAVVALTIRRLAMTLRPRRSTGFWVLAGVLVFMTCLAYSAAAGLWLYLRVGAAHDNLGPGDLQRELLLGRWDRQDKIGEIEFRSDGTFDWSEISGLGVGHTSESHSGQYRWVRPESSSWKIECQTKGRPDRQFKVVFAGPDELTLLEDDGRFCRLKRVRPEAPEKEPE
ncbi:MAG TPA: serine/threonine-protein kinase [Gemmataceae bacterium]|jgi:tRNA A-37 threonylcarbamoyl transferase component Bud32